VFFIIFNPKTTLKPHDADRKIRYNQIMAPRIGIYPGTFDPITRGHLHIIKRASRMVDHLIIAVAENDRKNPLFGVDERVAMAVDDIAALDDKASNVTVEKFNDLLIHYARKKNAVCIFRGLRAVSDFEYEFQMTGMNAKLAPEIETVFLMTSDKWQFVSSSFIKEIASLGGDVSEFVTPAVLSRLKTRFSA
jgi:pantetheine-phosphate adenylyltransferase